MAKVTMRMAPPDSPIYSGEYVISSPKPDPELKLLRQSLQTGTDGQSEVGPNLHAMPYDLTSVLVKIAKGLEVPQLSEENAEKTSSSEDEE